MKLQHISKHSFLLILMSIIMAFSCISVDAAPSQKWDGTVDISWYQPTATDYYISTPAQLAGLAALVNGMTDPNCPKIIGNKDYLKTNANPNVLLVGTGGGNVTGTVYTSKIDFAYKTVHLTANLDMGGTYNSSTGMWSGPNWTPIGGKFPMLPNEVKGDCIVLDTRFNGVFDGGGYTVSNIYCNRYAEKGFPYSMAIGLIGYLGGNSDLNENVTRDFEKGWQPSVHNVIVGKGYIYGRRMIGGVVGRVGATNNGIIIENCANLASIHNTDSKGIGGILGSGWGKGVVRNCYNAGTVSTTYACPAGGICGSNQGLDIYNCYSVGKIDTNGQNRGRGIGGHDSGSYTVNNCYYLAGSDDDEKSNGYYRGTNQRLSINVTKMTSAEMKGESLLSKLNTNGTVFLPDSTGANGGFPVLWYQSNKTTTSSTVKLQQPAEGGTISADTEKANFGQTVTFRAQANPGWKLDGFSVDGQRIDTNFYTITGNITVSATFSKVVSVSVNIPQSNDFYLAVMQTGYKVVDGKMVQVSNDGLADGDNILQGNVLRVLTHGYEDALPQNVNEEFTDGYAFELTNAVKNDDGTYTVTGAGNVSVKVQRNTQHKSWLSMADTSWFSGRENHYTLNTAAQLAGLAYLVNEEGENFKGITIELGNDISLANTDGTGGTRIWKAIGSSFDNSFQGIFDGRNHTIFDMKAWDDGSYAGLFGCCVKAVIKNVTVMGSVTGEANASYASGIVAFASQCTIEKCINASDIVAKGTHASGISSYITDGTILSNCSNYGSVSGISGVGGIVGVCDSGTDQISACANFGNVTALGSSTYGTGGIAGRLAGKMETSANYGAVKSSDRYTGGLVGYATTRYTSKISLSKNIASVSSDSDHVNAAVGSLVGYAQFLNYGGCAGNGTVSVGSQFKSYREGDLIGRAENVTEDSSISGTIPEYKAVQPNKPTASKEQNMIPKSTERPNLVKGGQTITQNGTYNIAWFSTGLITIGDGLQVTLVGDNGGAQGFTDLALSVGTGTTLTLQNAILTGNTTLLSLKGDNILSLKGNSALSGCSDVKNNENPTISVQGNLSVRGDGRLLVTARANNASIQLKEGTSLQLEGGTLALFKQDLMGFASGGISGTGSSMTINGGTFLGRTNSDNVPVIAVDKLTIAGGTVKAQALKSPLAISAKAVSVIGGKIMAVGHSGNSSSENRYYYNEKAISNLAGGKASFLSQPPFADLNVDSEYYDAVLYCISKNYFNGTSKTTFSPEASMNRAMFVTALYRMAGSPAVKQDNSFTDLKQDWYKNAVAWAVSGEITGGTSKTTFSPDAPVSREQAAVFLHRFAKSTGKNLSFGKAKGTVPEGVSSWAKGDVRWALSNNIFTTESGVMLSSKEFASRELLAWALMQYHSVSAQ